MPFMEAVPARVVRRLLCSLQGAGPKRPHSTPAVVAALVEQLGYVQIDSINVVERAHHLILGARLEGFERSHFAHALERSRRLFEHWTHDACAIPTAWYPHWHHRFDRYAKKDRSHAWWRERFGGDPARVMRGVLARVRRDGALRARDFLPPTDERREPGGWWNWHPEKAALEHLWRRGDLAVSRRERFEKVYDLSERVHPKLHAAPASDPRAHSEWACREALKRLGIATPKEISAFFAAVKVVDVNAWATKALARGEIERVAIVPERGGRRVAALALSTWRELAIACGAMHPATPGAAAKASASSGADEIIALAPFDPIVRDRARLQRLFDFDYRFEAFTPAPKRRYGYYAMPLLEGDRLIGRIDPKFDREAGVLLVRGPWLEPKIRLDRARRARLHAALDRLAGQIGATAWRLVPISDSFKKVEAPSAEAPRDA